MTTVYHFHLLFRSDMRQTWTGSAPANADSKGATAPDCAWCGAWPAECVESTDDVTCPQCQKLIEADVLYVLSKAAIDAINS